MNRHNLSLRPVTEADCATLRCLAMACPPLDVHTPYTYWVIAKYFGHMSFLLLDDDTPVGYITALDTPEAVFVWQIGILPEFRGQNHSQSLIGAVHQEALKLGKELCVTIADANTASRAAFTSYCVHNAMELQPVGTLELTASDLPDFYETERIYRMETKS